MGFTLLEVLIALFVGSVITGLLLFGVVEVLQSNQRENSRAETQREIKAGLDYISTELREAVFVYDGGCLTGSGSITVGTPSCPGVINFLPTAINNGTTTFPVLAFWRVDELPPTLAQACTTNATQLYSNPLPAAINDVPCLSRRSYSLVVYYLDMTNPNNTWRGQARIRRYELTQFDPAGNRNLGWVDPTTTVNNFLGWPFDLNGNNLQNATTLPDGLTNQARGQPASTVNPPVLIDFVDSPVDSPGVTALNACPSTASNLSGSSNLPAFVRTPTAGGSSFFACVRGGGIDTSQTPRVPNNPGGRNQEVALFIRGNAAGQAGVPITANATFEIETRTLTRGSYLKNPAPQ